MNSNENNHFEIGLVYHEEIDDEYLVEFVLASKEGDNYEIKNIPFFAKHIAIGDIVSVEENDGVLYFDDIIKASGHSTIRILFQNAVIVEDAIIDLEQLGCNAFKYENPILVAIDVPKDVNYGPIKIYLNEGKKKSAWEYQEACLGWK